MVEVVKQTDDLAERQFTPLGADADAPGDHPGAVAEPAPLTSAQIVAGAIATGREVFCIVTKLQSPKTHLNDNTVKQLGDWWGPVLDKHGIDLSKYMGDYALEIAAVVGTVTIGAQVRAAVIAEIAAREKPSQGTTAAPLAANDAANP